VHVCVSRAEGNEGRGRASAQKEEKETKQLFLL
jgi:hypothetical protein